MSKANILLSNFTAGEITPRLNGRPDVKKYANSCREIENFIVSVHGGARKRTGTEFVTELREMDDDVVLMPFQYSADGQAFVLAFGPRYVWFFQNGGLVTETPKALSGISEATDAVLTVASGHGILVGDRVVVTAVSGMTEINNRHFYVAAVTSTTITLEGANSTLWTAYASGGTVARIVTLATDYEGLTVLKDLQFAQINDVVYITHPEYPLTKLSRLSNTQWTLSEPNIVDGPFRQMNPTRTHKITVSGGSVTAYGTTVVGQSVTLSSTAALFDTEMVGTLFRLNEEGAGTGISSAPVGSSTRSLSAGQVYTNEGNVYGVAAVSGASNWQLFTRVPSHDAGTVRVSSGGAYFDSDFLHPTYCVVRITSVANANSATATVVKYQVPASVRDVGTSFWEEGAWSEFRGYPRAVTIYEQRLWLGGSDGDPTVIWSSRSGAYEDFEDGVEKADALVYRLSSGSADVVRWLSGGRVLTAGTAAGEWAISASSLNEALTPDNIKASQQATYGSSRTVPIRWNQAVLYAQRSGDPDNPARKLRQFAYSFQDDAYASTEMTIFSEHVTGEGFDRMASSTDPEGMLYLRRLDGQIVACAYEPAQEVIAWHRHKLGGPSAKSLALATIPGTSGDELWMCVERDYGGDVRRSIEVMRSVWRDSTDLKNEGVFLDGALRYVGAATTTISGLNHIPDGQLVDVSSNGAVERNKVVTAGRITLDRATSGTGAVVGFGYKGILVTQDLEGGAQAGTAQSRAKKIARLYMLLHKSLGGTFGSTAADQMVIPYRVPSDLMDDSPPLRSGYVEVYYPKGWDREQVIRIEHDEPLPFYLSGIVAELHVTG